MQLVLTGQVWVNLSVYVGVREVVGYQEEYILSGSGELKGEM